MQRKFPECSFFVDVRLLFKQDALFFLNLHLNNGIIVKTNYLRVVLAITLVAGFNLSANAGILRQDISPATRPGSSPLAGFSKVAPVIVVPMPAEILPIESQLLPQRLPQPLPAAVEDPATVPEPGTLATLAAGLVLMGVLARRRAAPRR
jgi:hypothetical protein